MITYLNEMFTFSSEVLLEKIQQSITSSQIDVDKVKFRNDLTESTCMLVLDGLEYTFSHRSFQEYFAAYFLCRVKTDEFERILPSLVQRGSFDNVLNMVSEMNKEKFEESWALPVLKILCESVKGIDARKNCIGYILKLIPGKAFLRFRPSLNPKGPRHFSIAIQGDGKGRNGKLNTKEYISAARHALYIGAMEYSTK